MQTKGATTIDEYIDNCPSVAVELLENLRQVIRKEAPEAVEVISYQMPAFKLNGILVYFAAHTKHIGFYPTGSGIKNFEKELEGYETSKGTIKFPFDKPIPYDLVAKIIRFRVEEQMARKKSRK